ncbi:hypothetical protein GCM10028821_17920 [Hymenobacter jeollabukensis]
MQGTTAGFANISHPHKPISPVMEQPLAPATAQNYNRTVTPERMAVVKVWDAMLRGARQYVEAR